MLHTLGNWNLFIDFISFVQSEQKNNEIEEADKKKFNMKRMKMH